MTHTEKVHVIFGMLAVLTGALAAWHAYHPASAARFLWPSLAFFIGLCLFVPVEAETRTYQAVGWWDTLWSVVPQSPRAWLRDWFAYLDTRHIIQHKIGGFLIMAAGFVEFQRGRGRLGGIGWGLVFPALLGAIGLAFGVHGGTSQHLPSAAEQRHHHIFGLVFIGAACALALVRANRLRHPAWNACWAVLVMLVGLDIAVFYRLTPTERAAAAHRHHPTYAHEGR